VSRPHAPGPGAGSPSAGDALCAVVLAAGAGTRLRPLTAAVPKALCPVGNIALLDRALAYLAPLGLSGADRVAVNACYLAGQIVSHVDGRAYVSVEAPRALGTSGAVANLRDWIGGRDVLVVNADAYLAGPGAAVPDLAPLLAGWTDRPAGPASGEDATAGRVRLLGVPASPAEPYRFGTARFAGASLLSWPVVRDLPAEPSDLVLTAWRPAERAGRLDVVTFAGVYLDAGTPADYLAANLHAARHGLLIDPSAQVSGVLTEAVVGAGATVRGRVTRGVVWPHGYVGPDEHLVDAVRVGATITVPAGVVTG